MAVPITNFDLMWSAYPNPGGSAEGAKAAIGGAVNAGWITNTCVIRMSRCFNYAGHPIPERAAGLATVQGGDGMSYAIRVREFRNYLRRVYGAPAVTHARPQPDGSVPAVFRDRQGVIAFAVSGWSDASGHIDLWDGSRPRHRAYFHQADSVELWTATDLAHSPDRRTSGLPPLAISGSVGQGGRNRPADVVNVQVLLYENGLRGHAIDGVCGAETIASIRLFQARKSPVQDGRVDPGAATWRALHGR